MFFEGEKEWGKRAVREEDRKVMVIAEGGGKAGPVYECQEHGLRARVAPVELEL